jgi:hypothetical protein
MATRETVTSKTKATTLYPMNPETKKQTDPIKQTLNVARKYCLGLLILFKKIAANFFQLNPKQK